VLSKLFCELYSDSITEDVYDASLAELSFSFFYSGEYMCIAAGGFTDKLPVLTETMLDKLKKYEVDPERFAKISDQVSSVSCVSARESRLIVPAQVVLGKLLAC
jgi:insulysin